MEKLTMCYEACSSVFLCFFCSYLFFSSHFLTLGNYSSYTLIILLAVAEMFKLYAGQLCGFKFSDLLWYEDQLILPPNQKNSKTKDVIRCALIFIALTSVYFVGTLLFGAEIWSKHEETFMYSLFLCTLTILPSCIHLGPSTTINLLNGSKANDGLSKMVHINMQGTLYGAWLGAFVIPLDWDRPWQVWPIPCIFGALVGSACANLFSFSRSVIKQRGAIRKTN